MNYTEPAPAHSARTSESTHDELLDSTHKPSDGMLRWLAIELLNISDFGLFATALLPGVRATFPHLSMKNLIDCLQFLEQRQVVLIDRTGPGSRISWSVTLTRKGKDIANYKVEPTFVLARPKIC